MGQCIGYSTGFLIFRLLRIAGFLLGSGICTVCSAVGYSMLYVSGALGCGCESKIGVFYFGLGLFSQEYN